MVRSQQMRSNGDITRTGVRRPIIIVPPVSFHSLAYIITGVLALLAIYAIMGNVMGWGRGKLDDFMYGTPRTQQLDAVVGHDDGNGTPTHLIAMNLNRQVVILELPGGDASKMRTLNGPYLFGAGEDKTPVVMHIEDVNRDGSPDLVVSIKNEEIIYANRDGSFQPISAEERAQLAQSK